MNARKEKQDMSFYDRKREVEKFLKRENALVSVTTLAYIGLDTNIPDIDNEGLPFVIAELERYAVIVRNDADRSHGSERLNAECEMLDKILAYLKTSERETEAQ